MSKDLDDDLGHECRHTNAWLMVMQPRVHAWTSRNSSNSEPTMEVQEFPRPQKNCTKGEQSSTLNPKPLPPGKNQSCQAVGRV